MALASDVLSPGEKAQIEAWPRSMQLERFLMFWSRKESLLKATGRGLTIPLPTLDLSSSRQGIGAWNIVTPDPDTSGIWATVSLNIGPGYVAALTVQGSGAEIHWRSWSPVMSESP